MPATDPPPPSRPAARRRPLAGALLATLLMLAQATFAVEPLLPGHVWYVDNTAPDGGDGSLVAPFRTLSRAERAADAGDTIYVFHGDGTDRGLDRGIRLKPRQRLIGSGVAFAPPGETELAAGEAPLLRSAHGVTVSLASHSEVAGLRLRSSGAPALGAHGAVSVELRGIRVEADSKIAVDLEDVDGLKVEDLHIAGGTDHALRLVGCHDASLRSVVVRSAGDAADDAAILVEDPAGHWQMVGLEAEAAAGALVAVEAHEGETELRLEGVFLAGLAPGDRPEGEGAANGLAIAARGDSRLTVSVGPAVLQRLARRGVEASATGTSHLHLTLEGSSLLGTANPAEGVVAHAGGHAALDLVLKGNDLPATDVGVLATANGDGRLRLHVVDNVFPSVPRGRGLAVVLADRAHAAVLLASNEVAGQRAEALFVRSEGDSRLTADLRDNVVVGAGATASTPVPSILLESRDTSQVCVALTNNRLGEGPGGGPALLTRQLDGSRLTLLGHAPESPGAGAQLAVDSRAAVESPAPAAATGSACPPLDPAPERAAPTDAAEPTTTAPAGGGN
jgi:hypothetical protein